MRRILILIAVASLFMVFSVPASAGAPEVFEDVVYDWSDELVPWLTDACGFDVYDSGHETGVAKGFFDREGDLLRVEVHVNGTVRTYKEGGPVLIDRYAFHITDDFTDETGTFKGNGWNVHIPGSGSGVVINDSGLVTFAWNDGVVKAVGPKDTLNDGWPQEFCDALDS